MSHKQVSIRQLELLIEFMGKNVDLALGRVRSKEGRVLSQKLWAKLAVLLNAEAVDGNGYRTAKEWNKFYNDYKCRIKSKARKIAQSQRQTGGIATDVPSLSVLEERLCGIIGPDKKSLPLQQDSIHKLDSQIDLLGQDIAQPCTSSHSKFQKIAKQCKESNEIDNTKLFSTEIEKARLEIHQTQIKVQQERNSIEKSKVEAINNLASAAWALVNIFKHDDEFRKGRKHARHP